MVDYDNELRGVLFKNDKDGNESRPDYTGTAQIKGVEYRLASWIKESQSGNKFMSISFTLPEQQQQTTPTETTTEDSVPF